METYAKTDIGKRTNNEDTMAICQKEHETLMIVCDGMGGHNSGELASKMVCDYMIDSYRSLPNFQNEQEAKDWMSMAILEAHRITKRYSYANVIHAGMGTTIVAALIYHSRLLVVSIGDSRCYRIDHDDIVLLTSDDTFVNELVKSGVISKEQAKTHEKRNILMKAIGVSDEIDTSVSSYELNQGYILLCSDGLYNSVSEMQIKQVLNTRDTLARKGDALILLSNRQGGKDNVTVVIAKIERGDLV